MSASTQRAGAPTRVAVIGARGKMGRLACEWIEAASGFQLVASMVRGDDLGVILRQSQSEVALDFTRAGLGAVHGHTILEAGVRAVIGTSGLNQSELESLRVLAQERRSACLVVPNFCLGIAIQQACARLAVRCFGDQDSELTVGIREQHHPQKLDSPSGTSLWTAAILEADGVPSVGIESERKEGVIARQSVVLTMGAERLVLDHQVESREAFRPGILLALAHVGRMSGLEVGLESAFEGHLDGAGDESLIP